MSGSRPLYMGHMSLLGSRVSVGVWLNVSPLLHIQDRADVQGLLILLYDPP